jgi:hypothetical protein
VSSPDDNVGDRLRAFLDYADLALERGRIEAAREALADAERLDAWLSDGETEIAW